MADPITTTYSPSEALAALRSRHFSIVMICGWSDPRAVALRAALATCNPDDVLRALSERGTPKVRA